MRKWKKIEDEIGGDTERVVEQRGRGERSELGARMKVRDRNEEQRLASRKGRRWVLAL